MIERLLLTVSVIASASVPVVASGSADPLSPTGRWSLAPVGNASTPPMGWNSWNSFGTAVDEAKVMGAAEALVRLGLVARQLGPAEGNVVVTWANAALLQ